MDDSVVREIWRNSENIKEIDLTRNRVGEETLLEMAEKTTSLTSLQLFGCGRGCTDKFLEKVSANNKRLESVSLCKNEEVTSWGVKHLASKCFNLRELLLSKTRVCDNTLLSLSNSTCATSITSLDLTGVKKLSEEGMVSCFSKLSNLVTLYLALTKGVSDKVVKEVSKCENLENVYLSGQNSLTDDSIRLLAKCTRLKVLNISNCWLLTDEALFAVSESCRQLDTVYLSKMSRLTPLSMHALVEKCSSLSCIEASSCSKLMTDQVVIDVIENLERLETIGLHFSKKGKTLHFKI